jgi:hypothetical protein
MDAKIKMKRNKMKWERLPPKNSPITQALERLKATDIHLYTALVGMHTGQLEGRYSDADCERLMNDYHKGTSWLKHEITQGHTDNVDA